MLNNFPYSSTAEEGIVERPEREQILAVDLLPWVTQQSLPRFFQLPAAGPSDAINKATPLMMDSPYDNPSARWPEQEEKIP